VHSLAPHVKITAVLAFVLVVVSTPIQQWQSFVIFLTLVLTATLFARIPLGILAKRSLIEIPFVFFAILMPFFGHGEKIAIGPFTLYQAGLIAGISIVAKGTLGVLMAVILSSTTTAREILRGLERLMLPAIMVQIASFMLRYVNVISDEMERMKIARESRGFIATGIKHWKIIATSAAALFIRSYERGERVHLAMLARGFNGSLPHTEAKKVGAQMWIVAFLLPVLALLSSLTFKAIG
jgi:cobalt/nickel transport system permease protein